MSNGWIRVTRKDQCTVCGKPDYCTYHPKIGCCCMRIESDKQLRNGGWLHPIGTEKKILPTPIRAEPHINATEIMREFWRDTEDQSICWLASSLGVDCNTLHDIGVGWAARYSAWAFPMRDQFGNIVGIRLRDDQTKKWAVTGSRAGLFFGKSFEEGGSACVCEGPTDTAAALTIGLNCIGRPSCIGQEQMLLDRLKRSDRILIIADNDAPGLRGAERFQSMLKCPSLIWCPPAKDIREFVKNGGTKALIDVMTKPLIWKVPK